MFLHADCDRNFTLTLKLASKPHIQYQKCIILGFNFRVNDHTNLKSV